MDAIDRLSVVDNSKIMWKVRVCVTRIWPSRKKNGVIVRQNLLLLDAEVTKYNSNYECEIQSVANFFQLMLTQNTHVHASTTPEIWMRFQNLVNEGSLCMVQNLCVIPANGFFRPVHHHMELILI